MQKKDLIGQVIKLYSELRDNLDEIRSFKEPKIYKLSWDISPYNIFSSYSTYKLNDKSVISIKENDKIDENHYIITSNTINLGNSDFGFKVEVDLVNEILKVISNESLILEEIIAKIDSDNETIKKHIILLLKFDLLKLNEGKNEEL